MNEAMITRIATAVAVAVANEIGNSTPVSSVGTEVPATKPAKTKTTRKTSTKSVRSLTKAETKAANRKIWNQISGHVNYAKSIVETDPEKALESLRTATALVPEKWLMPKSIERTYALINL
jgi:DNA helicase TIP49 (TBP-interacting protein)